MRTTLAAAMVLVASAASGCGSDQQGTRLFANRLWQDPPSARPMIQVDAAAHCAGLRLGGFDDWRLPRIDELRALVVGCPGREAGGACRVSDPACLGKECHEADECGHCPEKQGPSGGCYWDDQWGGSCTDTWFHWTSSRYNGFADHYWVVRFQGGGKFDDGVVGFNEELGLGSTRCVRAP